MQIFATSPQIASTLGLDHQYIIDACESMPYSDEFMDNNVQVFDVSGIQIAHVTEAGYRAIMFHIDCAKILAVGEESPPQEGIPQAESACEKILKWREAAFNNNSLIIGEDAAQHVPARRRGRSIIDENTRRKAEDLIASGRYDEMLQATFAEIHRQLEEDIGSDPGYQNVRFYTIARKKALGIDS
jgi:hypothetical protein